MSSNITLSFNDRVFQAITSCEAVEKCHLVDMLVKDLDCLLSGADNDSNTAPAAIEQPGLPNNLKLVAPRELRKRGIASQEGRNALMHSLAHIEYNAINLALDAAYRFRDQPGQYYRDWISVAADEARHFSMIQSYLNTHGLNYGDLPGHNGLWQMVVDTAHCVTARMALVPRVLEARGLDVSPKMIERLKLAKDQQAAQIVEVIYHDEIGHVAIGSKWFRYHCEKEQREPNETFRQLVSRYFHGELKGPFNIAARLQAGFDQQELNDMQNK